MGLSEHYVTPIRKKKRTSFSSEHYGTLVIFHWKGKPTTIFVIVSFGSNLPTNHPMYYVIVIQMMVYPLLSSMAIQRSSNLPTIYPNACLKGYSETTIYPLLTQKQHLILYIFMQI
jgi:hypothetical protein